MSLLTSSLLSPPGVLLANTATMIVIGIGIGLIAGSVGMALFLKFLSSASINTAKKQAEDILAQAKTEGETTKKQIELDARNEQVKRREAIEKELEEARDELAEKERRLTKREDNLDRKLDMLTLKEKNISDLEMGVKKRE